MAESRAPRSRRPSLAGAEPRRSRRDWVSSGDYRIRPEAIQPASIDLRLGDHAWALRCSFLPDVDSTVEEKIEGLAFQKVDLRDGAVLERDRPYLVPLIEELALPEDVRAKANPKSSTGRLDVFTRVITDRHHRFDDIRAGYRGKLYLEVVPRSFAIQVKTGLSLNQLRLARGDVRLDDGEIRELQDEFPLLYLDSAPAAPSPSWRSPTASSSASTSPARPIASSATGRRRTACRSTSRKIRAYRWTDYWDPVFPEAGGRIVLEPEIFYLLLSAEGVCIPPQIAAEMMAYDPTAGELRTHYAGFFDPGFGYDPAGGRHGSRAALEVRARDVSFMVEHRQPVCKLGLERMEAPAERLYGAEPRLQLPGPGDDAQQALRGADRRHAGRRRIAPGRLSARSGSARAAAPAPACAAPAARPRAWRSRRAGAAPAPAGRRCGRATPRGSGAAAPGPRRRSCHSRRRAARASSASTSSFSSSSETPSRSFSRSRSVSRSTSASA